MTYQKAINDLFKLEKQKRKLNKKILRARAIAILCKPVKSSVTTVTDSLHSKFCGDSLGH